MVVRAYPQHLRITFRATFFLALHTTLVRHGCVAFGADAHPSAPHSVLTFLIGHLGNLLTDFIDDSRLMKSKLYYLDETLKA